MKDMKFKISSGNLFEGLAEIIAKQVEENSVSNLNIGTKLPNQTEMIGNTVVKTEEPTVEFQIVEGFKVKLDLYDAQQLLAKYKADLQKEFDREAIWKEKYETILDENERLQEEKESIEKENEHLQEEINQLKIQLAYAENHPQQVTNVYGTQYNNSPTDNHSEVKEMKVENEGIGVKPFQPPIKTEKVINQQEGLCCYIVKEKANSIYSADDATFQETRLRVCVQNKQAPSVVDFLRRHEKMGILNFLGCDPSDIYDELEYYFGELKFKKQSFKREWYKWNPK